LRDFGIEEGAYAFQHGQIGLVMQFVGVVVCIGAGAVTALVTATVLRATIGLKVPEVDMAEGLDSVCWGVETDVVTKEDLPLPIIGSSGGAEMERWPT
jgi:ammonium transporter, Amt family